jgi:uncharacterized protein (TIGR03000 family)
MYSVVLMMAITTGGEAPDMHRHGGGGCGCEGGGRHHLLGGHRGHRGSGCYGGGCYGGYAYAGGCYGGGCYGGYGGCYGGGYPGPYYGMPGRPGEPIKMPSDKKPEDKKPEDKKPIGALGAPARIVVSMPADARFTIDDYTTPARSATHVIVSSPLGADETRTYSLKAEVVRDGKVQTIEERVTVRSGDETQVTLSLPTSVASR